MRTLLIWFLSVSLFIPLRGQGVTDDFIDSLYEYDYGRVLGLRAVRTVNYALSFIEELDTVVYYRVGDELVYFYRKQQLDDPSCPTTGNKPIMIRFSSGHGSFSAGIHFLDTEMKGVKAETLVQVFINFQYNKVVIKHLINDLLNGKYCELTLSGEKLIEGYYAQVDSTWQDTVLHVDPITYDFRYSLVKRDQFPVKIGRWLYYNEQGDTIKIEEYPEID